jgi:hypothetical protein
MAYITYGGGGVRADFFDDMSSEVRDSVRNYLYSETYKNIVASPVNGSMTAEYSGMQYSVRKYGDNFYSTATLTSGKDNGKIYRVCYFFKKVD